MAFVSQTVRLDMKPQKNPPHVDCTQYDSGADGLLIHFVLFNDGSEFSVPSGYTAKLEGTTKENTGFIIDPYSIDTHGVSLNLTEDATAFKGSAWCKIVFEKGSSRIATSGFWLDNDRAGVEADTVIGAPGFETQIQNAVDDYLDGIDFEVDDTLTQSGKAADAAATGSEIALVNSALSDGIGTLPFVGGYWNTTDGSLRSSTATLVGTRKIPVVPGTNVRFDHQANLYALYYDKNGNYLRYQSNVNSVAIPEGCYYVAFDFPTTTDASVDVSILTPLNQSVSENTENITDISNVVGSVIEKYESRNLFNGEYEDGYRNNLNVAGTGGNYAYSKPIFLHAGEFLFTSTQGQFGANGKRAFLVDANGNCSSYILGTSVGTKTEVGKYNNRDILHFTLQQDGYVSFNVGLKTDPNPATIQVSNFMVVVGSTIQDFPNYEAYFEPYYGIGSDIPPSAKSNGLSGLFYKTAIFDGDSICHGTSVGSSDESYRLGWAGRIGNANFMNWHNYGINGGIITSAVSAGISDKHSVLDNIDTMFADYPDADYVVFEGGTNDADSGIDIGTFSENDFSGNYDKTTFSGSLETLFYKAMTYWKGKFIGYIVAQKMGTGTGPNSAYEHRKTYFERAKAICAKWGIPYIDLWNGCYLDPHNPLCYNSELDTQGNIDGGYLYVDGQHLTARGYDYISPIIEGWMKAEH